MAISSTAQYITALGDYIYISSNYGSSKYILLTFYPIFKSMNLALTQSANVQEWQGIAISSSGQYQTAGVYQGFIYASNDFGSSKNYQ